MNTALRLFRKKGVFAEDEIRDIREWYKNSFHVHLQPIMGGSLRPMAGTDNIHGVTRAFTGESAISSIIINL